MLERDDDGATKRIVLAGGEQTLIGNFDQGRHGNKHGSSPQIPVLPHWQALADWPPGSPLPPSRQHSWRVLDIWYIYLPFSL